MTSRQIQLQVRALVGHVVDAQGKLQPKLAKAVFAAVAESKWPHRRILLRQFVAEVSRIERRQRAVVWSAESLSEADRQRIERHLQLTHAEISAVDWQRNPDLVGGLVLQIGDTWHDLSLQQRLTQIQEYLG